MGEWVRQRSLGILFVSLFLASWIDPAVLRVAAFTSDEQRDHGGSASFWSAGFWEEFGQSTFENWQSEFLAARGVHDRDGLSRLRRVERIPRQGGAARGEAGRAPGEERSWIRSEVEETLRAEAPETDDETERLRSRHSGAKRRPARAASCTRTPPRPFSARGKDGRSCSSASSLVIRRIAPAGRSSGPRAAFCASSSPRRGSRRTAST